MATLSTSSGFADLVGACEIVGDDCISYTSNNLGAGTVTNLGSPSGLMFRVDFPGTGNIFVIKATPNGYGGFSGTASNDEGQDEPWAAGATAGQEAVAGRS